MHFTTNPQLSNEGERVGWSQLWGQTQKLMVSLEMKKGKVKVKEHVTVCLFFVCSCG